MSHNDALVFYRNSKTQIVLEVFRPPTFTKPSYLHYNSDSGVVADYASTTSSTTCRSDGDYKDQLETSSNISSSTSSSNSSIFYSASMVGLEGYPSHPMPEKRYETKTNGCFQDELQGDFQQRKPLSTVTNKLVLGQSNNNKNATSNQAHKLNCVASHNANNNYDTINNRTSGCLPRMGIKSKKSSSKNNKITPSNNNNNNNDHGKIDSLSDDLDQSKSLELETKLEACIADVVSCLEDFVASCQLGVNKFVKPMRAAGLSQDHFKTLFQNIEMVRILTWNSCVWSIILFNKFLFHILDPHVVRAAAQTCQPVDQSRERCLFRSRPIGELLHESRVPRIFRFLFRREGNHFTIF